MFPANGGEEVSSAFTFQPGREIVQPLQAVLVAFDSVQFALTGQAQPVEFDQPLLVLG